MVLTPNGDTDFFNIVDRVLQRDTLAPYLFITCQNCVLWMSIDLIKENGFTIKKKAWTRENPAETITDTAYEDDLVLLANTPA